MPYSPAFFFKVAVADVDEYDGVVIGPLILCVVLEVAVIDADVFFIKDLFPRIFTGGRYRRGRA